ncbi:Uncharacterised protein [Mycobacteroides abscessus]|nr:Uncharacterised protein [Mycobacteroides abscessus]
MRSAQLVVPSTRVSLNRMFFTVVAVSARSVAPMSCQWEEELKMQVLYLVSFQYMRLWMTSVFVTVTSWISRGVQPHWMTGPFSFFQITVFSIATSEWYIFITSSLAWKKVFFIRPPS